MAESTDLQRQVSQIAAEAEQRVRAANAEQEVANLRREILGRKGSLTALLKGIGSLPPEDRPVAGRVLNEATSRIEALLNEAAESVRERAERLRREAGAVDVTLPGRFIWLGRKHPLTRTLEEICEIFLGLGFTVAEGPEIETEWHNFTALNIDTDHPVMDEKDSFYIGEGLLLRTETSAVQIRVMEQQPPPVRIIAPGRVYRRDTVDATHSHTFYQVEGLWVDEGISFAHLKGVLTLFVEKMFGPGLRLRFRPDYFPFVEPGAEVSYSCYLCAGEGCGLCKHTGWIELGGCGMVHPNVLENVGYDAERFTGFAFGLGLERLAMRKHGIDDMRLFYENDLRFLHQFH